MEKHLGALSGPCADKLSRAVELSSVCEADVKRLCGGVARSSEIVACMKPKLGQVGGPCRRALAKVAMRLR